MDNALFINHYSGIRGGYVEFQIVEELFDENYHTLQHWSQNSIYADCFEVSEHKQFLKYLPSCWELGFNELSFKDAISLAGDLSIIPECKIFSNWLTTNMKPNLYLRIMGA